MPKFQELRENHSCRQNYGNNIQKDNSVQCPSCGKIITEYSLEVLIKDEIISVYHLQCNYLIGTINMKGKKP
ncbi:MAG TPA: hypothetical protein P5268_08825 [Candidatus Marinimicrobia bacterium]|jgi:predicted  nucleic acid-binding Zn ribbon protein|nr:hypothetical protein [Candidatus Neomarinimicrobiota bacterium]HRS52513.1 hypothetical protein [Candidatus Neomarinimicrobiota bacterium]HRU93117.1 hypothetical protein [Candidatus Neomarinimicrobiota bacterium]